MIATDPLSDEAAPQARDAAPNFVHLHVHSEYSLLDGACRVNDLITRCQEMNMGAIAVTDHGNLYGAVEFYEAASRAGIKPIIGCELYLAPGDRRERGSRRQGESAFHLLLLAANNTGYQNLIKLSTIGFTEGFYYKPRIDKQVLEEYSEGLICTSTCIGGEVPQKLLNVDYKTAKELAETYLKIFGPDRFFFELQDHGMPEQKQLNPELADLANKLGCGMIATNDVHYLTHDDVEAHDVLCCISTRARVQDENRFKFPTNQFFLKSQQEMIAALPEYPEALSNTLRVADMCDVNFDFTQRFAPKFVPPDEKTDKDYLRELVYSGAAKRYDTITDEMRERIDYELEVIQSKGFSSYFLIVWDFIQYARRNHIPVNTRGSGCSSVVGYCLEISAVDPLRYGLYFERFMDPDRDEMPDIDVDMCQARRQEVIEYVRDKYGHVAQIITFGRLKARACVRDVCRALDVPLSEADRVAKLVPEELKMTIDKALERDAELKRLYDEDTTIRKVLDIGKRLEGIARHSSIHAAGVVVADQPLDSLIPLAKPADGKDVTTQFEGPVVERVGLLKMDFLGLRTLSQIQRAIDLIRENHGVTIDVEQIPLDDQRVYEVLQRGDTRGIFQFESGGMRDVLQKMRPNRIEDLIAANALYRPGPMKYIDDYVARKHGRDRWNTPHPVMTEVLEETYGIMVYQEQVSRIVNRLGDVPLRRAFRLAKAISKKKEKMINAEREPFLSGAEVNGVPRETAEQIFADILEFGSYAFNKAHSTGYAVVAYQTAYLKAHYPVEFMAAVLTYESGNTEKIAEYLDECRRIHQSDGSIGVPIKPPNINESDYAFTPVYPQRQAQTLGRGEVLFGLGAINGIGEKAIDAILAARQDAPFTDLFDFCERVDLSACNRAAIERLIKAGAFDSTGAMRRALMTVLEGAIESGHRAQRDKKSGQLSIFGGAADNDDAKPQIGSEEWSDTEMLQYEKETLGFFVTKHPLTEFERQVKHFSTATTKSLKSVPDNEQVVLGGLITRLRTVSIKNGRNAGKKMVIAVLEDFSGSVELVVFSEQLAETQALLKVDAILFVVGTVDGRREEPSIRVQQLISVEDAMRSLTRCVILDVNSRPRELEQVCTAHRGAAQLYLRVSAVDGLTASIRAGARFSVDPTIETLEALRSVAGVGRVQVSATGGEAFDPLAN